MLAEIIENYTTYLNPNPKGSKLQKNILFKIKMGRKKAQLLGLAVKIKFFI